MKKTNLFASEYVAPCIELGHFVSESVLCSSDMTGMDDVDYTDYGDL